MASPYKEQYVTFTRTAAQMNALDATAVTVVTIPERTGYVRVPKRCEVYRAAGTAYVLGSQKDELDHGRATSADRSKYIDAEKVYPRLIIREKRSASGNANQRNERNLFEFPLVPLVRTTSATMAVAEAPAGEAWFEGAAIYEMAVSTSISTGTGTLTFRVYFEDMGSLDRS